MNTKPTALFFGRRFFFFFSVPFYKVVVTGILFFQASPVEGYVNPFSTALPTWGENTWS